MRLYARFGNQVPFRTEFELLKTYLEFEATQGLDVHLLGGIDSIVPTTQRYFLLQQ